MSAPDPKPVPGTETYVDWNGKVRYKRAKRKYANSPTLKPIYLTLAKVTGEEETTQEDWEKTFDQLGMGSVPRTAEWREHIKGMSATNVMKNERQGYKKRHSWKQPRNIDIVMRRAKALELRRAGYTYAEIAAVESLGYKSIAIVQRDLQELFKAMLDEPSKDVLALELSRLEAVVRYLWTKVREGDLAAINSLFQAMKIKHNLIGLNQPIRHEVITGDLMDQEIARLTQEIGDLDSKSIAVLNAEDPDKAMPAGPQVVHKAAEADNIGSQVGGAATAITKIKEKRAHERRQNARERKAT